LVPQAAFGTQIVEKFPSNSLFFGRTTSVNVNLLPNELSYVVTSSIYMYKEASRIFLIANIYE